MTEPAGFRVIIEQRDADASGLFGLGSSAILGASLFANPATAALAAVPSSRRFKAEIDTVDPAATLAALRRLPLRTWKYTEPSLVDGRVHIGPMAEDFQEAFGVGDGTTINVIDMMGVLLSSMQALAGEMADLKGQVAMQGAGG